MDKREFDYIEKVSELAEFIAHRSHARKDVIRYLALSTFLKVDVFCAVLAELTESGDLEVSEIFGSDKSAIDKFMIDKKLSDANPIAEVLRFGKISCIQNSPQWPSEYIDLNELKFTQKEITIICFPIEKFGSPGACITLFSSALIYPNVELKSFLRAVSSLLSLYLYKDDLEDRIRNAADKIFQTRFGRPKLDNAPTALSDRQMLILRLVSKGFTNIQIAEQIGYSESTVRQETVRIFAILVCSNRIEAGQIYRDNYISENKSATWSK
jgi:DNA-binding CsgD family transcriptional regulator